MEVPPDITEVAAQAANQNITHFPWITWVWVVILSSWGGVAGYIKKVRTGRTPRFSLMELVGEIVTSSFAGVITFLLARAYHMDELLTAALVGLSGHMGSRVVYLIEGFLQKRFGLKVDVSINENPTRRDKP